MAVAPSSAPVAPRAVTASASEQPDSPQGVAENAGFGANRRLREAREFGAVFDQRRVLRGERFHLHYRPNGSDSARLGLVVAKKLAKRAVWRNAVKRVGREAFRVARQQLPPMDLILRLAKPIAAVDAASKRLWRTEIDDLLARLPR